MFLNSKGLKTAATYKVTDYTGMVLSVGRISSEPYMTIDWPHGVDSYLSVVNAAADIDVLLRGYVGGYPDAKPYASWRCKYCGLEGFVDLANYENAKKIGKYAFSRRYASSARLYQSS